MRKITKAAIYRVAFGTLSALILIVCLFGILVSGPILVNVRPLELDVATSPGRMRDTVHRLTALFAPRDYEHPENLDLAADWIAGQLGAAGLEVEYQEYEIDGRSYRNVIGFQPGSDPDRAAYVVGAHYDAYGSFPGADDNASGVAVLLELARTRPQRFVHADTYFVAFSTEEPPFFGTSKMGSYVFAEKLANAEIEVELMLALECLGYFSDNPGSQHFPFFGLGLFYPDKGNFIAVVGDLSSGHSLLRVKRALASTGAIPVHSFRAPPSLAPVDWSDHQAFRKFGFPAVMITDTAFMRNPHYHSRYDTAAELDYELMGRVVHALQGVLWDPAA